MTPMTPTELNALAEKVAGLNEPDTGVDAEIALAIGWSKPTNPGTCGSKFSGRAAYEWHDETGISRGFYPPEFTASLDAGKALAPPGWDWSVETFGEDGAHGKSWKHGWHDDTVIQAPANTAENALVSALLRARAASLLTEEGA